MQEPTDKAKQVKQMTKDTDRKQLQEKQQHNSLHAWYVLCSKSAYVERKRTRQCLRSAGIKAEKEEFILASQEQLLSTRNYQGNILTNEADPKCGIRDEHHETIHRLVSGYFMPTPKQYKARDYLLRQY